MTNDERIDRALENGLESADWEQLQREILENEDLREAYVDRAWLHGQLKAERERLPNLLSKNSEQKPKFSAWQPAIWAAAAALVTALIILGMQRDDSPEMVATLVEAEDCRWAGSELPTAQGAQLGTGKLKLVEGMATLQFESGATVTMEAPTTLEVLSKMRCRLVEGSVVADVPEPAHGFTIDAPNMEVIDLGTRFGVTASPFGNAQVFVFEGEVEVERENQETKLLTTGKALHVGQKPPVPSEELSRIDQPLTSKDGWIEIPTSFGSGQDAYVRLGDRHGPTGAHPLLMVKETDLAPTNRRRIFLTFDLSHAPSDAFQAAELILNIEPSGLGFSALVPDSRFAILGLQSSASWNETDLIWKNAPEIESAARLAEFEIKRGVATGRVEISSPELASFLRELDGELANLVIVRETGETNQQGLVHAFASKEHPTAQPPILRLKTP